MVTNERLIPRALRNSNVVRNIAGTNSYNSVQPNREPNFMDRFEYEKANVANDPEAYERSLRFLMAALA